MTPQVFGSILLLAPGFVGAQPMGDVSGAAQAEQATIRIEVTHLPTALKLMSEGDLRRERWTIKVFGAKPIPKSRSWEMTHITGTIHTGRTVEGLPVEARNLSRAGDPTRPDPGREVVLLLSVTGG